LKPCEPLFGDAGVQTTICVVDRDQSIHGAGHTWSERNNCGNGFRSVPTLRLANQAEVPPIGALDAGRSNWLPLT
jgi:hypothetical protein